MLRSAFFYLCLASAIINGCSGLSDALLDDNTDELHRFHTFSHSLVAEQDSFGHDAPPAEQFFTRIPAHAFQGAVS
jgi:hypothetical protein